MYKVIVLPKALTDLGTLEKPVSQRIVDKLTWLSEHIESIQQLPLKGSLSGLYKLRLGDWRVIYDVDHRKKGYHGS